MSHLQSANRCFQLDQSSLKSSSGEPQMAQDIWGGLRSKNTQFLYLFFLLFYFLVFQIKDCWWPNSSEFLNFRIYHLRKFFTKSEVKALSSEISSTALVNYTCPRSQRSNFEYYDIYLIHSNNKLHIESKLIFE